MTDYKDLLLHLSLIEGIGPVTIARLLPLITELGVDNVYRLTHQDFEAASFSRHTSGLLSKGLRNRALVDNELALIKQYGISWTTLGLAGYPELLASIYAPPAVLYWQGQSLCYEHLCAIVGSRACNTYGKAVVDYLVKELVDHDIVVVSGGALGIDAAAHTKTLEYAGKTVVVVGSGLLHTYPSEHKSLFARVADQGGSVVSIFPLQTRPAAGNFPARNRVISGISHACVVVQAAEKSGALISAHHALEQGRSVFVVPGSLFESVQKGCHQLAQQGACLISSADDVIEVFQHIKNNSGLHSSVEVARVGIKKDVVTDPLEQVILELCMHQPQLVDVLIERTGALLEEVQAALFRLQLIDLIEEYAGGVWKSKI